MSAGRRFLDQLTSWSPVLLLGGLAALTYWLDAQVQTQGPRRDGTMRHDPDLFVEQVRAVTYDADGRVQQSLAAARAEHFPDNDGVEFVSPAITLTEPGKPRFAVTANRGTLTGNREIVIFNGNVRATRDPQPAVPPAGAGAGAGVPAKGKDMSKAPKAAVPVGDATGPITVTTQMLRVFPKAARADTTEAVTIEEPRGIIQAVGMEFDNQARTLKLKSNVRGTLQPPSPAK
jgi:lipopolysaccharide export system protein LptC